MHKLCLFKQFRKQWWTLTKHFLLCYCKYIFQVSVLYHSIFLETFTSLHSKAKYRTLYSTMFLKNLSFLIILNWRIRRLLQDAIAASDAWTSWFFSVNLLKRFAKAHWGLVHTNTFSFETHLFLCILRQCFVKESRSFWKRSPKWKTLTTPFSRCSVDCENGDTCLVMWRILYQ